MKKLIAFGAAAIMLAACSGSAPEESYTVIVSLDAFRWDYPDIFDTPCLDRIAAEGVKATMRPSYPASTFPNHFTLATGLVPDHHGIINSSFRSDSLGMIFSMGDRKACNDVRFYKGEPVWATAERQGVRTGIIYWVGCAMEFSGVRPGINHVWEENPRLNYSERIDEALRILSLPEDERPRLLMLYFDDPDLTTHEFGPTSAEGGAVVHYLDSLVGVLYDGIKGLPYGSKVNLIITADHGMTDTCDENFVALSDYLRDEWIEDAVGYSPTNIYTKEAFRDSVYNSLKAAPHISVWKKEEVPAELHYGSNPCAGDIIVAPDLGWQFGDKPRGLLGVHGYRPSEPDMQVVFRACGPGFRKGFVYENVFGNTAVYPLLCHLLGIVPREVDGCLEDLAPMLTELN